MKKLFLFVAVLGVVYSLCFSLVSAGETIKILNEKEPGAKVDIEKFLVKGKTNIFDFYADWCGPCKSIAPQLEKLAAQNKDVVVMKVNIDKWNSPVCQQYQIRSVPNFKIYDASGKLQSEGGEAYGKILQMTRALK